MHTLIIYSPTIQEKTSIMNCRQPFNGVGKQEQECIDLSGSTVRPATIMMILVFDFRFGHRKCPNREWGKGHFRRWKWPFPHSRFGHFLRPLFNTIYLYDLRNHIWPLESGFLMRKSEKKGHNFLGPWGQIFKFTYFESSLKSSHLAKTKSLLIFV